MTPSEFEAEILRIERAHDQRKKTVPADCDSFSNLGNRCIEQEVQRSLLKLLGRCDGFDLQSARVLNVGCGRGQWLRDLISWGAQPGNLVGIDINKKEIQRLFPSCRIERYRITRAPPLARIIGHYSSFLYAALSASKLLCTHYLALIHKPASLSAAQL